MKNFCLIGISKKLILNKFFMKKLKIYLFEKFIKKTALKIFTLSNFFKLIDKKFFL